MSPRDPNPPAARRKRAAGPAARPPGGNPELIITAAAGLFAERGLAATLAEVAGHAGVGVATVYRNFATKDELIYEVYADRLRAGEDLAREAAADPDAWQGFVRFFEQSIGILAGDRGLRDLTTGGYTRSLGWARGSEPDRLAGLLAANHQAMGIHLTQLVQRAKEAGGLRNDFEPSDMMLLSVAVQATITFAGSEQAGLHRRALGFILDGLRPARPSATALPAPAAAAADLPQARRRR